jgi:hypothetical protein
MMTALLSVGGCLSDAGPPCFHEALGSKPVKELPYACCMSDPRACVVAVTYYYNAK